MRTFVTIAFLIPLASGLPAAELPEPLDELSRRAVRYFVEASHPETGFTRDRARNDASEEKRRVASIAATGFALSAYAVGAERGWLQRADAIARTRRTLRALEEKPVRERGWFYHFFDWETGERVWRCEVSSIDTAIFLAGLVLAERALDDEEITTRARRIFDAVDWRWMLTDGGKRPDSLTFSHGWKPESGFLESRWGSYCEHIILYVLALGVAEEGEVSAKVWEAWKRPEVEYEGLLFLVGGPLFLHQMSHVFIDLRGLRDRLGYDYYVSSRNATLANRRYCIVNPKGHASYSETIWGLSACDGPEGYRAFGALGRSPDNGTVAPAAAVASVIFTPKESLAAARAFAKHTPGGIGRYGFTSGWNPGRDWHSPDVIGIDLGQLFLAIENHRDGLPYRWMREHDAMRRGLERAGLRPSSAQELRTQ